MLRWSSNAPAIIRIDSVTGVARLGGRHRQDHRNRVGVSTLRPGDSQPERAGALQGDSRDYADRDRLNPGLGADARRVHPGLNNTSTLVTGVLTADSIKSRDTTVLRDSGATLTAKKNGTSYVVWWRDDANWDQEASQIGRRHLLDRPAARQFLACETA